METGQNKNFGSPISSGTGDIILNGGGTSKKSRRGLVITVLIILLILVGGGILLWQSGVFGGGKYKPTADLTADLRKIINYAYSGEQSEAVLEEISDDKEFRLETEFYSEDTTTKAKYFEIARNLQADAMKTLLSNDGDAMSEYNTLLTDISSRLYRISSVAAVEPLYISDLKNNYVDIASVSDFKKIVEEKYERLLNSKNDSLEFYGQAYVDFLDMRIDEYALIAQNGCLDYVSSLDDFNGLENCPNLSNFVESLEILERAQGELGYVPATEKTMADSMIQDDVKKIVENYKQLNMELNQ